MKSRMVKVKKYLVEAIYPTGQAIDVASRFDMDDALLEAELAEQSARWNGAVIEVREVVEEFPEMRLPQRVRVSAKMASEILDVCPFLASVLSIR